MFIVLAPPLSFFLFSIILGELSGFNGLTWMTMIEWDIHALIVFYLPYGCQTLFVDGSVRSYRRNPGPVRFLSLLAIAASSFVFLALCIYLLALVKYGINFTAGLALLQSYGLPLVNQIEPTKGMTAALAYVAPFMVVVAAFALRPPLGRGPPPQP